MSDYQDNPSRVWDKRYAKHPWSVVPDMSLVEFVEPLVPGRAIDLGCGTGRNALWLARQGWDVTGVDGSTVGLRIAAEQARREGLSLTLGRDHLLNYELTPESFDLVVLANIHLAPEQRDAVFARAASAVVTSGHLYISGHHVIALGIAGPPDRERLFDEAMFRDRFNDFRTEVLERRETLSDADATDDIKLVFWAEKLGNVTGANE